MRMPTGLHVAALAVAVLLCPWESAEGQGVTSFDSGSIRPHSLVADPDGAIWFEGYQAILRLSRTGSLESFPVPGVWAIAMGPDGNLWFTDDVNNNIGKMTPSGAVTVFPLPIPNSNAQSLTAGPDGAIWFYEFTRRTIGRITTEGSIKEYALPGNVSADSLAPGPDDGVWFTGGGNIGRISSAGLVTVFPARGAFKITPGPDGALWYCGSPGGRITTSGEVTEFDSLVGTTIAAGSDGALWFTKFYSIGRLTTAGEFSEYSLPPGSWGAFSPDLATLVSGADGALWFGEYLPYSLGPRIGRMDISVFAAGGCPPLPDPGNDGLATSSIDFESIPVGTPPDAISIPDFAFTATAVTGAIEDSNVYPLQTISGKALAWTVQTYRPPGAPYPTSGILTVDFPAEVSKLKAKYAMRANPGQHHAAYYWSNDHTSSANNLPPFIVSEPGNPAGPYFKEGVIEFPDALTPHGEGLTRFSLVYGGSIVPNDLSVVKVILDDLEVEFAPPCRFGTPEISSWPGGTLKTAGSGTTVSLAWAPADGVSPGATYVVEVSKDCEFSTLESSMQVADTSTDVVLPSSRGLLYVRVYAEDSCGGIGTIRSPGSARAIEVQIPERHDVVTVPGRGEPRVVPRD